MKVIVLLDQIQAGLGGKEKADTPLGGKKLAMGAADTLDKVFRKHGSEVIGTFYCGTEYYQQNKEVVQRKVAKMAEKMQADVVVAGPTYDYPEFSTMACELALRVQQKTTIPVVPMVAIEKNQALIEQYRESLMIVKMPKKGGTGLSDAIDHMVELCQLKAKNQDITDFVKQYCY
ncbi:GrdB-related putative oxidoreductase [Lapidilactobacillus dextrinicus]|uniref:GrdB-related putative oxidoreductase n=1 Tax=Lapidilactobacillus dextrinicus TaxID=51664 RepID=UPI0022E5D815|nr:GrdB-related putative oxidoreductase [Lapidilactobacillus dextrinicus]